MDQKELIALKNKATELRIRAVDMIWKAQSGHPGLGRSGPFCSFKRTCMPGSVRCPRNERLFPDGSA